MNKWFEANTGKTNTAGNTEADTEIVDTEADQAGEQPAAVQQLHAAQAQQGEREKSEQVEQRLSPAPVADEEGRA